MKSKTEQILVVMHVLCWIAFIGLMIKAGAILFSFAVTLANAEGAHNVYRGLDLYNLRQYSIGHYAASVSFMVAIAALQAYIAFLVITVLGKIKLEHPFKMDVSVLLERIGYYTLVTWGIAVLSNGHTKWLWKRLDDTQGQLISLDFIFLAGVVFVISQIFKKGVAIQSEHELTV